MPYSRLDLRRRTTAIAASASLAAVLCCGRTASADFGETLRWMSVGGNIGTSSESETHALFGAEASVGVAQFVFWGGAYADALYDAGTRRVRFTVGPELGILFLGVDGGILFDVGEGEVRTGLVVRPMLAFKFVFPYARFGRRGGSDPSTFSEAGVLVKYPFFD